MTDFNALSMEQLEIMAEAGRKVVHWQRVLAKTGDNVVGDVKTLQKFAAVHASIHNHFNQDRHLNRRDNFKQNRSTALAEWRQLAA